jgi:hypothetical protein
VSRACSAQGKRHRRFGAGDREPAGRLQTLEALTDQTNRQLAATQAAAIEDEASADHVSDRALASLEHLSEVAEEIIRSLDDPRQALRAVQQ